MTDPVRGGNRMPAPREAAEAAHRQVLMMSAGLTLGVVTFVAVVAFLVLSGTYTPSSALPPFVGWGLGGVGVASLLTGRAMAPHLRESPPSADAATVTGRWVSGSVVSAALAEVPGILGGVVGLLSGDLVLMGALAVVSVAGILSGIPSQEKLEQRLRRLPGS